MENKYYTPEIEEFHVNFEFESKETFTDGTVKTQEDYDRCKWVKKICEVGDTPYIERALIGKNAQNGLCGVRVKHLDIEDIESLGWKLFKQGNVNFFTFRMFTNNDIQMHISFGQPAKIGFSTREGEEFSGLKIKNKSELRKLMQMLNIE